MNESHKILYSKFNEVSDNYKETKKEEDKTTRLSERHPKKNTTSNTCGYCGVRRARRITL